MLLPRRLFHTGAPIAVTRPPGRYSDRPGGFLHGVCFVPAAENPGLRGTRRNKARADLPPRPKSVLRLPAGMRPHLIPGQPFAAFRTRVFCDFLMDPLGNTDFLHALRVGNDIGMITNTVDHRPCAEFFQLIAGELLALIAANDAVICCAFQKSMLRTMFAPLTNKIG